MTKSLARSSLVIVSVCLLSGCGNQAPKPSETNVGITPATRDERNTNFREGDSVLKNAKRTGDRTASLVDFQQLALFMTQLELTNNTMPTIDEVKKELQTGGKAILKKIDDGAIILTGTKQRQTMWAYEVDADKAGGVIILNGQTSRATAEDVKKYLAQK